MSSDDRPERSPARTGSRYAPVHVPGEVLSVKRTGAFAHVTLTVPDVPDRFRPGTFLAVSVSEERLARRPFWIHRAKPTGGYGATVELVVEPRGPGSTWLATRPQGHPVEVTGPLGRPFALPKEPVPCLLVGQGYAAAPLFSLAARLHERGCPVTLLLGATDEPRLLSALDARRSARAVSVVTEDGSVGAKGTIADVVGDVLARADAHVVYAAGSLESTYAATAAAEQAGAWSQTAVETPMTCGTGLCHGCTVPVVNETGGNRWARACVDGPVFRGDRLRWADLFAQEGR